MPEWISVSFDEEPPFVDDDGQLDATVQSWMNDRIRSGNKDRFWRCLVDTDNLIVLRSLSDGELFIWVRRGE